VTKSRSRPRPTERDSLLLRALRTRQGHGCEVYSFFIPGNEITRVADITRIHRDEKDELKGFQRREIREHVKNIAQYLDHGNVLFPNAIILALSPEVKFIRSRGPSPVGVGEVQSGSLKLPIRQEGERTAWIVDGQQRSLALAQTKNQRLSVPVVAFVSDDVGIQREQFILVNKAKPLPVRLINELLPETSGVFLPRDLASRRIPSELCGLLNKDPTSPFYQLLKRPSDSRASESVMNDAAVVRMIRNSINNPLGALAPFKSAGESSGDLKGMYKILLDFWTGVKEVFPGAWGIPPSKSRLSHSAGIEAMGYLMDKIFAKRDGAENMRDVVKSDLKSLAPYCRWTEGQWEEIDVAWNAIESTPRDIRLLADALVRLYVTKVGK
jgi:DGQHR domain-containing protein